MTHPIVRAIGHPSTPWIVLTFLLACASIGSLTMIALSKPDVAAERCRQESLALGWEEGRKMLAQFGAKP